MTAQGTRGGTEIGLDHVGLYLLAADRFASAVGQADLSIPVATCPGWSAYDLVCHLGNTHAWAATIVETGRPAAEQNDEPRSQRPHAVPEWYVTKAEDLYRVLRAADPEAPCWNFAFGAGRAGFWSRRQLHETAIHLLDLAPQRPLDLGPEVYADGVDEVLRVFLRRMHDRGHAAELSAPLCLVASDLGRAWTLTPRAASQLTPGPPLVVDRPHPSADRVEAPAEVLYRLLWHRLPSTDPSVRVTGDLERVQAFLASRLVP